MLTLKAEARLHKACKRRAHNVHRALLTNNRRKDMNGKIRYGFGEDIPVSPKTDITTAKGNTCTLYICSEYNPDEYGYMPLGWSYKIIWNSYGDTFRHTKEWNTITDSCSIDEVIDEFTELYGRGRMYILANEIVTRS